MKAIIYKDFKGAVTLENVEDPEPKSRGVVVEVKASGLCLSDWHGWMGHDSDITLPHVPGHEYAGIISAIGKHVENWQVGDRVVVPFINACGTCSTCISGNQQVCPNQSQAGFTHWGSFAEHVSVDFADVNLVSLDEGIDFVTAASLGCRFATSYRGIVDQGKVNQGDWVLINGCGGVGLSAVMIAKSLGARVIGIDINDSALNFARLLNADYVLNSNHESHITEKIIDLTHGGAHVSVDAIGHPEIVFNSILSLRRRGKHIQIGILNPEQKNAAIPMDRIIAYEIELVGSHGMQAFRYNDMLRMIKTGRLQPQKLIHSTISLEDAALALPEMHNFQHPGIRVIDKF